MKTVLILGASSDIGVEVTKLFLLKNFNVIAHYNKNINGLKKIKNKQLKLFKFNLLKINNFEKYVKKNKIFNNIDIFISLTGYLKIRELTQTSINDFYNHINVNYLSNFIVTKKIISNMQKKMGKNFICIKHRYKIWRI